MQPENDKHFALFLNEHRFVVFCVDFHSLELCRCLTWLESKTEEKVMAHFSPASPNGLRTGKAQNKLTMGGGFISLKWNKNDLVSMLIGCVLFVF